MKALSVLSVLVVALVVNTSCRTGDSQSASVLMDSSSSIQPLPEKNERHEMCGIESYKSQAHSLCGVKAYKANRTAACGVELYKERADLACPGSVSLDEYEERRTGACRSGGARDPEGCRDGYHQFNYRTKKESCCGGPRCDFDRESEVEKTRSCRRDQSLKSCRLAQFGVERYKSCRHADHGVESWNTCARAEFGIDKFKQCSFYLAPAEVNRYLASVKELLPYMGETLVNAKAMYYVEAEDEAQMSCHVEKYDADPLFSAQMAELKTIYQVRFGRAYAAGQFSCDVASTNDIDTVDCPDSDQSRLCKNVRSYRGAKKWITVKQTDLTRLATDVAAKRDALVKQAIESQLSAVKNYEK